MHCTNGLVREGQRSSGRHRHIGVMEGYPTRVSSKSGVDHRCRKGKDKHSIRTLNKDLIPKNHNILSNSTYFSYRTRH